MVSESSEIALTTGECRLVRTVSFINTTAYRTGSRSVSRVNRDHRHTNQKSFVFDEAPKLVERPGRLCSTLRFSSLSPLAYAGQFFDGNSSLRAFCLFYKSLGYRVVHVGCEALFFAFAILQQSFRGLCALALEFGAKPAVSMSESVDDCTGEYFSVRVNGDVLNAEIDAENCVDVNRFGFFNVAGGKQVEHTIPEDKIRLTLPSLKKLFRSFAARVRYLYPACESPDGDELLLSIPSEDSVVEGNRASRLKCALGSLVEPISLGNFLRTKHGNLGRQSKATLNSGIGQLLELKLSKRTGFPRLFGDVVTSTIGCLKRLLEGIVLFLRRQELYLRG